MTKIFEGVCTALVTPFSNGSVDLKALGRLIETQDPVQALLILGTTGEAASLTDKERDDIISWTIKRTDKPVIVGASGNSIDKVLGMVRQAKRLGANAVLVTPPYYIRGTQDGIVEWFKEIGKVGIPVIVYNIPGRAGVNIAPETMAQICKDKAVVGIKESSGNIEQIADVLRLCPDTPVYCGDDAFSLPCYAMGSSGVISVASNAKPAEVVSVWETKAAEIYLEQLPFYRSLFDEVNPVPIKKVLSDMGLIKNEVRAPLTVLV
ncbi:MAG: 4-hydroxy-tetrahydrodipicolinate synthase [Firmicutes bacterium]|nr:4-hydroxy-tetrahydrodipicolinate synthase [Bacillota bacterium]